MIATHDESPATQSARSYLDITIREFLDGGGLIEKPDRSFDPNFQRLFGGWPRDLPSKQLTAIEVLHVVELRKGDFGCISLDDRSFLIHYRVVGKFGSGECCRILTRATPESVERQRAYRERHGFAEAQPPTVGMELADATNSFGMVAGMNARMSTCVRGAALDRPWHISHVNDNALMGDYQYVPRGYNRLMCAVGAIHVYEPLRFRAVIWRLDEVPIGLRKLSYRLSQNIRE